MYARARRSKHEGNEGNKGNEGIAARASENTLVNMIVRSWRSIAAVAVGGFAFGVLDLFGQGALRGSWNYAANSISVWLTAAFVAGALIASQRWSAVGGMGMLLAALAGYYLAAPLADNTSPLNGLSAFWFAAAIIGGPIFGYLGFWWREGVEWQRVVAAALLGGAFISEGARLRGIVPPEYVSAGWGEIVIGVLIPLLLGRTNRVRLLGILALLVAALLGFLAFKLVDAIYSLAF